MSLRAFTPQQRPFMNHLSESTLLNKAVEFVCDARVKRHNETLFGNLDKPLDRGLLKSDLLKTTTKLEGRVNNQRTDLEGSG